MKTPSFTSSLLACKCQKCRTGKIFKKSVLNPLGFSEAHDNCPVCGHKFEEEPGYFWGAMYVSYGFSAGLMLVLGILSINLDLSLNYIYTVIIPLVIVISPFSFRYSRMIMLYFISKTKFDYGLWKQIQESKPIQSSNK
jgi:uncharacterized protein (DUF983 family)